MLSQFWHDLICKSSEILSKLVCALRETFFKDGMTLATWGLAAVTLLLVIDSWRKGNEQRNRWNRDDEQRDRDREEERQRWKRDDQARRLQSMDSRFNSPGMIAARKRMANEMREQNLSQILGKPTAQVRPVIAFLAQVAQLCKDGLLEVGEVDLVYRDHVMLVWSKYGGFLTESFQNGRYDALQWLRNRMSETPSSAAIDSELAASISFVLDEFLEREADL